MHLKPISLHVICSTSPKMKSRSRRAFEFIRENGFESSGIIRPSLSCDVVHAAARHGAPTDVIVLGSSYFQRLAIRDTALRDIQKAHTRKRKLHIKMNELDDSDTPYFVIVYCQCIALAMKAIGPRYTNYLDAILRFLSIDTTQDARLDLERECLRRLKWRLIPLKHECEAL